MSAAVSTLALHYDCNMLLLGIDLGTSSVKVSVIDAHTQEAIVSVQYPETERTILSPQPNYAEQSPNQWWEDVKAAIKKAHASGEYDSKDIAAIGISYQMHGLVCIDKNKEVLRNAIIWCDSRAVEIGEKAYQTLGEAYCNEHLLNSPGNFTASKLKWIKDNEPKIFEKIDSILLPGDFIAMKLTGAVSTTISALSEGIFWDFKEHKISAKLLQHYGINESVIPPVKDLFSIHGQVQQPVAKELGFKRNTVVSYKAGDQPNNALSLNVLNPGEVAATAGTSGVIYSVTDKLSFDQKSRVNSFAHVNHSKEAKRIGVLLCINGTGIFNRWIKDLAGNMSYQQMNEKASRVNIGSEGLMLFPFGNGAERMLENKILGAALNAINFNIHTPSHVFRAVQEGIAFAFKYGFDILKENNINPTVIRTGNANMFLSNVFTDAFVNTINVPVELYNNDGSVGAALGAGIGAKIFETPQEAFGNFKPKKIIQPTMPGRYEIFYKQWLQKLQSQLF